MFFCKQEAGGGHGGGGMFVSGSPHRAQLSYTPRNHQQKQKAMNMNGQVTKGKTY